MWPLPPIHKSSAGHGWRAGRNAAFRQAGAAQGEAAEGKQARPLERASGPASAARQRRGAALGWALRGPCRGGGASDGASCAAPSLGGGAAPGNRALGTGEGVSRVAAEQPRTPAGFLGCAEREPQRSAPAPGSCDLAALGATPSTRLPGFFLAQGSNPCLLCLLCLLHWQAGSSPAELLMDLSKLANSIFGLS